MLAEGWNRTVGAVAYDATASAREAAQESADLAQESADLLGRGDLDSDVLEALDAHGFGLGDVWKVIRPVIEGAAAPVVKSTGWLAPIVGGVMSGILDAVGEALP